MALVSCSECGKQISTLAERCPSCGAPVKAGHSPERASSPAPTSGAVGKIAMVVGAWLVVPWMARALAFVVGVVAIAMIVVYSS